VSSATNAVVDLVVDILETAKGAGAGVGVPLVVRKGVEVAVGEQQQADIAAQ